MALINPMNVTSHHQKVGVTLHLAQGPFLSGDEIRGKFTLECRTERGLGLAAISVELTGFQELTSRDHASATTFLHTQRYFQGPGLPISNAVLGELPPDSPIMPRPYHPARKGQTSFFYQFPLPQYAPSSIDFGHGLAKVRYEVTANVEVFWKGEKRVVTIQKPVRIMECLPILRSPMPNIILGEGGKIHVQGRMVNLFTIIGHSACLELFVQNHSNKKTHGVTLRIIRRLHLRHVPPRDHPLQLTDALGTIPFNGPEYSIAPGGEGVANLVFDIPTPAYGAGVGLRSDDRPKQGVPSLLFTVECELEVTIGMPMGSQAIIFSVPLITAHPETVPELPPPQPPQPLPMAQPALPQAPQYNPYYAHDPYPPLEPPRLPFAQNPVSSTPPSPQYTPNLPPSPYTSNSPYPASPPVQNPYFPQYSSQPTTPLQAPYPGLPPFAPNQHVSPPPVPSPRVNQALPPVPSPQVNQAVPSQPSSRPLPQPTPPSNGGGHITWQSPLVKPASVVSTPPVPPQPVQVLANLPPQTPPRRGPLPTPPASASTQQASSPARPSDGAIEGKGVIASRVTQHLRQTSRTRSTSPPAHRFPLPPVPSSTARAKVVPAPLPLSTTAASAPLPAPPPESPKDPLSHSVGSLVVPQSPGAGQVATGLSQSSGVLSPRPRLSPRISYDESVRANGVKVASIKSKPVEELERMAEEVLKEEEKEGKPAGPASALGIEFHKDLPVVPGSRSRKDVFKAKPTGLPTASEIFGLDAQPAKQSRPMTITSVPLKPPALPRSESGLDALERRLAGERSASMDAVDQWMSRRRAASVADTASDSDASSVRSYRSQPGGPRGPKKPSHSRDRSSRSSQQPKKEGGLPAMPMPRAITPPRKDHEKEVKQLQKEAVNRVGDWIGGVPPADPPGLIPWATLSGQQMIPKTSSGFVSTKKSTFAPPPGRTPLAEVFTQPPPPVESPPQPPPPSPRRGSVHSFAENAPLQAAISTAQSPVIASKKVERQLLNIGPLTHAYDVRSARGGRGGVVTAVTAIWETKPVAGAADVSSNPADVVKDPTAVKPQTKRKDPPVFKIPTMPASASLPTLSQPSLATDNAILADKPGRALDGQRINRALPDPAAINGTLARPYLSSTASLANGRQDPIPRPRPHTSLDKPAQLPISQSAPQLRPGSIEPPTSPKPGAPPIGVGQAKLRELIAKYQTPAK
ncbi:hypothetical protein FRC04_003017 [Tulasnella sp. 424]|nr:hypothetical protein FRC04_003017 [Tulasnella sp. 424]KAG8981184.1 hypothetical protein FRC05_004085 [Tulasnella sp. 425]